MTPVGSAPGVRTNFYVDAFNLYYGALKGTHHKWLDLEALFMRVFPRNHINRIRYFTARVDGRPPDFRQPERQNAYLRALQTINGVSIHFGQYRTRPARMRVASPRLGAPKTVTVLRREEKGSDVNLASYLLVDAFRNDCEVAIVVSNDADLKTPMELATRELEMRVGVLNPHPRGRAAWICVRRSSNSCAADPSPPASFGRYSETPSVRFASRWGGKPKNR